MRWWLLTWTTYGTWLPGDERGFVSRHWLHGESRLHNLPGTAYDHGRTLLKQATANRLKFPVVRLSLVHAEVLREQVAETCQIRGWNTLAGAIMATHVHLVVCAPAAVQSAAILQSIKAYGSRALNAKWPREGSWWTESGSRRHLLGHSIDRAAHYVLEEQEYPLVTWRGR